MGHSWTTEELFNLTYLVILGSIIILGHFLLNWFESKLASLLVINLTTLQHSKLQFSSPYYVIGFLLRLPLLMIVSLFIRTNLEEPSYVQLIIATILFFLTYYLPYSLKSMLLKAAR